jgi:hypothetical protein
VDELWEQLHALFDADDGSPPDIFIEEPSSGRAPDTWVAFEAGKFGAAGEPKTEKSCAADAFGRPLL